MKKMVCMFCAVLMLAGCASLSSSKISALNREGLSRLSTDMRQSEALSIMKRAEWTVCCQPAESKEKQTLIVNNPYRSETIQTQGKTLEVFYFVTDAKEGNCVITNDQLTPLVFNNNKLMGWGWKYYNDNVPSENK